MRTFWNTPRGMLPTGAGAELSPLGMRSANDAKAVAISPAYALTTRPLTRWSVLAAQPVCLDALFAPWEAPCPASDGKAW